MKTQRICLWSGPRNVSTALMYSFAQRDDTIVVDEPLYGHYLAVTGADHPGRDEVLATMQTDGQRVIDETILGPYPRPVVFFKSMAHHLVGLDFGFWGSIQNVLLIRDPADMLRSLVNQLPQPQLRDTGLDVQVWLMRELGPASLPVLEARALLGDPAGVLSKLCARLDLPFQEQMLTWPAGPRPEDGIWARHWYHNVHASSGFRPYPERNETVPEHVQPLLQQCRPMYEELAEHAIRT